MFVDTALPVMSANGFLLTGSLNVASIGREVTGTVKDSACLL